MSQNLKLSIITVSFNSAKTIEKTIQSVLSQQYDNIEYIIIDGGSTDGTVEIINRYKSKIAIIVSEPDKGLYDAMNKGIILATGEYIGILNSDDTFFNNTTIIQVIDCLNQNRGIDAIIGDIVQHNGNKIVRQYSSKSWNPEKLKIGFMPPHPSIFFKSKLFDSLGSYNLQYTISADYELITRFFLKNKINYKYSGLITTSMLRGGASSSGFESYRKITAQIMSLLNEHNIEHSPFKIHMRFIWKALEWVKA